MAASKGKVDAFKLLLAAGANTNAEYKVSPLAFHQSAVRSTPDVAVKRGQDGSTPMLMAAQAGHAEIAQILLDSGAEFDVAMTVRLICCLASVCKQQSYVIKHVGAGRSHATLYGRDA